MEPTGAVAAEIRSALGESRRLFVAVGLFSAFVNLLMLTGPLFMLQIYDRVLTSRSEATLVALAAIVTFLFLMMGLLDHTRARVLARVGARFQARLDGRVLGAILTRAGRSPASRSAPATGLSDLEAMQPLRHRPRSVRLLRRPLNPPSSCSCYSSSTGLLGVLAVISSVLLLALALLSQARTARLRRESGEAAARAAYFVEQVRAGGETVRGLGMRTSAITRTGLLRHIGAGQDPGGLGPRRRLRGHLARPTPVPAIDDAGARRLAGHPGRGDAGDHDRGVDPAGARPGANRSGGGPVAVAAAHPGGAAFPGPAAERDTGRA